MCQFKYLARDRYASNSFCMPIAVLIPNPSWMKVGTCGMMPGLQSCLYNIDFIVESCPAFARLDEVEEWLCLALQNKSRGRRALP